MKNLLEVICLFARLGFTAFGGPAAHLAMYHDEVVRRRKWIDEEHFLDLLSACQLIPGPNSTEMVMHLGFLRAGWPGLLLGGAAFILPAALIVTFFAWLYVEYGSLPEIGAVLYGVKPVVLAIIVNALWDLGKRALKTRLLAGLAALVLVLALLGVNELLLLFGTGLLLMLIQNRSRLRPTPLLIAPFASLSLPVLLAQPFSLSTLFWTFVKIGSVLYGRPTSSFWMQSRLDRSRPGRSLPRPLSWATCSAVSPVLFSPPWAFSCLPMFSSASASPSSPNCATLRSPPACWMGSTPPPWP
jgi:chromate transporter